ncbi:leucine-rich repeat domain, L domain-like protein [Artemisia annua]|uniref:Leucine-rich repeat domain, L domain-like protein n=1 Tax=Artemisia annua TaxID=35608 RepID=A0A2U1NQW5_ARTAN|nr:leucine-rich repeat domain, L domain-like protein [Artemisia annua]
MKFHAINESKPIFLTRRKTSSKVAHLVVIVLIVTIVHIYYPYIHLILVKPNNTIPSSSNDPLHVQTTATVPNPHPLYRSHLQPPTRKEEDDQKLVPIQKEENDHKVVVPLENKETKKRGKNKGWHEAMLKRKCGGGGNKSCDLFSGEWVENPEGPYYTNETCWAIQEHQNCMKFGRMDRDFLKWRWKPYQCELPIFDPMLFLEMMRGKSLAFVGDSVARNHMQSLLCLLSRKQLEYYKVGPPPKHQGSRCVTISHARSTKNSVNINPQEIDKDYISKLLDGLLARILSVHPLDSGSKAVAVYTGFLNRPYCIKHGGPIVKIQDLEYAISNLLVNFDENNPLKMPTKLEFHYDKGMIVATIGLNKKLSLDFSKVYQDIPRQFEWEIVLNTLDLPQISPYPFCVKTLKLTSVNYSSCKLISSLINKFRYVESLIIEKSSGLRSLRVEGVAKLVSLSVIDCDDLKSVNVKALELESLRFCGSLCSFSLQNVIAIRDVKVLTIHGWMYKDVFGPLLFTKHNEQHFRFSRLQELWWIDSSMEDDNINSLFCFLKFCTSLKRLFVTVSSLLVSTILSLLLAVHCSRWKIDPRSNSKPCANHQSSTMIQKGRLRKLKVVKLEGFENEVDIILFNEHLMEVFSVEPLVVEMRQGMQSRGLVRIPKRKARESDKLKFCYKFVGEVEDTTGLCPKHPHMP